MNYEDILLVVSILKTLLVIYYISVCTKHLSVTRKKLKQMFFLILLVKNWLGIVAQKCNCNSEPHLQCEVQFYSSVSVAFLLFTVAQGASLSLSLCISLSLSASSFSLCLSPSLFDCLNISR